MANVTERILDAETDDGPMATIVTEPEGGGPVVVVFQDAPGIRGSLREFCQRLAHHGYTAVMPDLHHRHGRMIGYEAADAAADPSVRDHVMMMLGTMTDAQIQHDRDVALTATGHDSTSSMGCIGFCLGARAVFHALEQRPDNFSAGAMWHPSFLANDVPGSPHHTAADLAQPLFVGIGTADRVQSIEMHQPFFEAVAPLDHVEVEVFDGADHGYTWPTSPNYHDVAATISWERTTELFDRTLVRP